MRGGWLALLGVAACLSERPRPGPPTLAIVLDQQTVHSPDTLTGRLSVRDPDGLDSIWISVDSVKVGEDALFDTRFEAPFLFAIRANHQPNDRIPVRLEARDLTGFSAQLDTAVRVVP